METTSLIHTPCLSTENCSIWWRLCYGIWSVQLVYYGTPHTSRDDSDRWQVLLCPITYTHSCPLCIPTDWDNSSRTMQHPTRGELLPSGSRNTLMTLDTSIGYLNPQT
ncbi:hypothetical protein AVEN_58156-1 [Araneus ventricosus]|uniref:Uncharacterized protein n=1 Tax=Araneus ventricosus TaxID=182803 RepID=A0A4Y2ST00_ARAVE|nr:hypothetical protein AVEN_58156-1 [Araneus ventricosus]